MGIGEYYNNNVYRNFVASYNDIIIQYYMQSDVMECNGHGWVYIRERERERESRLWMMTIVSVNRREYEN